jgi:hypothetical protein
MGWSAHESDRHTAMCFTNFPLLVACRNDSAESTRKIDTGLLGRSTLVLGGIMLPSCLKVCEIRIRKMIEYSGPHMQLAAWLAMCLIFCFSQAKAQTPEPRLLRVASEPARPPLNPFPAVQNWSFLADSSKRTDRFDPVKYVRSDRQSRTSSRKRWIDLSLLTNGFGVWRADCKKWPHVRCTEYQSHLGRLQ